MPHASAHADPLCDFVAELLLLLYRCGPVAYWLSRQPPELWVCWVVKFSYSSQFFLFAEVSTVSMFPSLGAVVGWRLGNRDWSVAGLNP